MPDLDEGIKVSDEALAEMIAAVYRGEWDIDAVAESRILDETRAIFHKAVERGVPRSKAHRKAFKERLNESVDVFATFRVHRQAEDCARELTDEEGRRRTFRDWAERVQPYLNHQNRAWLQTEYSTAIRRAHDEAEWERFMEDADIYPNLEWMPSTSAQPGADHKVFWGTVLSKDDPFWGEHRPGDRWNCKCSLRQTDKEADKPGVRWKRGKGDEPQAGLRTKPGSGEIFSDDHPYFPKSCGACPYGKGGLRGLWNSLSGSKGNCGACRFIRTVIEQSDEAGGGSEKETTRTPAQKARAIAYDVAGKGFSTEPPVEVGQIDSKVMDYLKTHGKTPNRASIVLTAGRASHALRKVKTDRGAALTADELAEICDHLSHADVYFDKSHDNLLYVVEKGGRVLKFAIQLDYKLRKVGVVNAVVTAGVVTPKDIASGKYEKIK